MIKSTLALLFVLGLVTSCSNYGKEAVSLDATVDSLKTELAANQAAAQTLQVIWSLLDSIDMNHSMLRSKIVEGASMGDYSERMREIGRFTHEAEQRIGLLEKDISSTKSSMLNYSGTVRKLKKDLETRDEELADLKSEVEQYSNQNNNLQKTVGLQKAEILDNLSQIETKQHEIALLEGKVKELLTNTNLAEADAYFDRARAVEEVANRTRFAPRKKRETKKEALELYKIAASYGKEEAKQKVSELEKEI